MGTWEQEHPGVLRPGFFRNADGKLVQPSKSGLVVFDAGEEAQLAHMRETRGWEITRN